MPSLDELCAEYIGKELVAEPFYGWGWKDVIHHTLIDVPEPFTLQLHELYPFKSEIIGGLCTVKQKGHPLDSLHCVFYLHHEGRYNFDNAIGDYNIQLGSTKPVYIEEESDDWPYWQFSGNIWIAGYAYIKK